VTVAGGGIAGISAALRLAERGYAVKLIEANDHLGGNLGSREGVDGKPVDVYPHMYLNWYRNFWRLLEDATGTGRGDSHSPFATVWQLRQGEYPKFAGVMDAYSPWNPAHVLRNLRSGVAPPADMFVFGYASIDLLAERMNATVELEQMSVSAFLEARPYITEQAAQAYNNFLTAVWALPSYLTSAADYRQYLDYCLADPTPAFWLLRGSASEKVIGPLTGALEAAGVEILTGTRVTGVSCDGRRVSEISLEPGEIDRESGQWRAGGEAQSEDVEELVLAVPAPELSRLVRTGGGGRRIVELAPQTSELSRLSAMPIPIVHLYFTRKLRCIPPEPVGLTGSQLALAFTDISQTWDEDFGNRTVLALSASDPHGLPRTSPSDDAMTILREAAEYLDFDPGEAWGDSRDIDWERTRYDSNADAQLFVNEIGTDAWRPAVTCEGVANLCFAGDFCRSRVGMTTIESAVTTGIEAAAAIVRRHGFGEPVEIAKPRSLPAPLYVWLRYGYGPYAMYAKAWSAGAGFVRGIVERLL
jgi:predicted NAD/FAD-dependent oxidoreductase